MTEKTVAEKRDGKLLGAVRKKALGYTFDESVEEYASVDGALQLVKKKVTKREAPPDVSAARLMLELSAPASDGYE
ncbi:MAG: hypothetical protein LBH24_04000, partial [Clostridiales bacterium]|nr:hypothetical protein [Clostridiales bacterium]